MLKICKELEMHPTIPYKLKRSIRAKRLRLAVYCDGSVVVTTPFWAPQAIVEKFLVEKKQWILDKVKFFKSVDRKPVRTFSRKEYKENKEKARVLVQERIAHFNQLYGFAFKKISIRNQKTRWGSCSRRKNLNFNFKICFLPQEQQDYIIVHELCHLKEFNHSKAFWALVEKTLPNHRAIRKELCKHQLLYQ